MKQECTDIAGDRIVNDVIRECPQTIPVFNEFGIDSCCGGAVAIDIAAQRDGADAKALLQRLNAVARTS